MRTTARIAIRRLCPSLGFRQDVLGRVVVPVGHVSTRRAGMRPDREGFLHNLPAVRTDLRGEVRRYLVHPATGAFSLEAEDVDELRPPRIADGPCKVVVLDNVAYPQVLDGENGALIDVLAGGLVGMVLALAGHLEVLLCDRPSRLLVPLRALLAARKLALRPPESLRRLLEASRVLDRPAIGVGGEDLEPNVDAHGGRFPSEATLLGGISEVADDEDVPVTIGPVDEVGGLGRPFERAMLLDLEATAELLGDPELARVGVEVHVPPGAVLPKLYRVPALRALEAREADLPYKLPAVKETLEGLVEPVRESLYRTLRDVLRARATATTLEPIRKVVAGEELPGFLVMRLDRFEHFVVKTAAFRQARKEQAMLSADRIKAVFESLLHTTMLYRSRDSVAQAFTSRLKATALSPSFL
jgi:hypothetical protein